MISSSITYKNNQWKGLNEFKHDKKSVQLLIVFADRLIIEEKAIFTILKNEFPKAEIIISSTAGEISRSAVDDNSATILAISFEQTAFKIVKGNIREFKNSFELGKSTVEKMPKENLSYIFLLSDGNIINGDELIMGIQSNLDKSVIITGGLAGDGVNFNKTLVGYNDDVDEGNIILLGLYGDKIKIGTSHKGGWDVFGPERIITKSEANILHEIDGENALDLYKKYLGKYADELPASALFFPLSIKSADNNFYIVRTILSIDEKNKTMRFAGNIPEGSTVRFMKSNFDRLLDAATDAGLESTQHLDMNNIAPSLSIIISCVGRKIVLGERTEEEIDAVLENLSPEATVAGFFSYGEVAPQKDLHTSFLHNQTITITTFAEAE
jgi:hypothetical protein